MGTKTSTSTSTTTTHCRCQRSTWAGWRKSLKRHWNKSRVETGKLHIIILTRNQSATSGTTSLVWKGLRRKMMFRAFMKTSPGQRPCHCRARGEKIGMTVKRWESQAKAKEKMLRLVRSKMRFRITSLNKNLFKSLTMSITMNLMKIKPNRKTKISDQD